MTDENDIPLVMNALPLRKACSDQSQLISIGKGWLGHELRDRTQKSLDSLICPFVHMDWLWLGLEKEFLLFPVTV